MYGTFLVLLVWYIFQHDGLRKRLKTKTSEINTSTQMALINLRHKLSPQSVDCRLLQTLSVCLSVCPAFTAYIYLAYYGSDFDQTW